MTTPSAFAILAPSAIKTSMVEAHRLFREVGRLAIACRKAATGIANGGKALGDV